MTSGADTEIKIIEAAIACVERLGERRTTVREIAQEAGVNVAAINYYFRSKEHLMKRVKEITLRNAFDWSHFSGSEAAGPEERMKAILEDLVAGAQRYPQVTRSHFLAPLAGNGGDELVTGRLSEFLNRLHDDLVSRGATPGDALRVRLIQVVSASVLGIGLHIGLWSGFFRGDLMDPSVRRRYIEQLVQGLF
jgi:AcrR family transcriptional regulator